MLARVGIVEVVERAVSAIDVPLVVDPVLHAGGGEALGERRLRRALAERLFPLAAVVTCNLSEAAAFTGRVVDDQAAMERAARAIGAMGARAVVVKGGHLPGVPVDVLWDGRRIRVFRSNRRIDRNMHGTGCAFASAVAAGLARGTSLSRSVADAGRHVRTLLREAARSPAGAWLRQPPRR
jgi:hydroxymethylpyrimidine/phosphomethylpyrimidine kinase